MRESSLFFNGLLQANALACMPTAQCRQWQAAGRLFGGMRGFGNYFCGAKRLKRRFWRSKSFSAWLPKAKNLIFSQKLLESKKICRPQAS